MIDIQKTIKELGLRLYNDRGDECIYWCPLCGDHSTHAHLNINQDEGKWHCFYCGRGHHDLEVLCKLLDRPTVIADEDYRRRKIINGKKEKKRSVLSDRAIRLYFDTLEERGFRDFEIQTLREFNMRYDPDLQFPVFLLCDEKNKALGYGIKGDRYIYQPEHVPIGDILFGLNLVQGNTVCLAEGPTDVMRIHESGFPAVGVLGNNITSNQLSLLRRFNEITLISDNDRLLLQRAGKLIHFANVYYVVPQRKDIQKYSKEEAAEVIKGRKHISQIYSEVMDIKKT
jgi:DNA primase